MLEIERLLKSWDAQLHGSPISAGLTYLTPEGPVVLLWLQGEDRFGHLEVVAHEMLHAAWRVMYHCAIGRNESTEEVLAYLTGSLVKRTVRAIKKFGKEVII